MHRYRVDSIPVNSVRYCAWMLDHVSLLWYHLDDESITATRGQVRRWVTDLGLPGGILRRSTTSGAFVAACTDTEMTFEATGEQLAGRLVGKRTDEHVTVGVFLGDAKVGEVKWFAPRRTEAGLVTGSHRTKFLIKTSVPAEQQAATREWIRVALARFEEAGATVPWSIVRRIMRLGLERRCVPIVNRRSEFFFYSEDLDAPEGPGVVGEFLSRCAPSPTWTVMRLDADNDGQALADSADAFLHPQVAALVDSMETWVANTNQGRRSRRQALAEWVQRYEGLYDEMARHESRLAAELTQTRSSLLLSKEMIDALDPSASLPSVTSQ
jgi:hypothetical protein